jgi:hypothetical protein
MKRKTEAEFRAVGFIFAFIILVLVIGTILKYNHLGFTLIVCGCYGLFEIILRKNNYFIKREKIKHE